MTLPRPCLRLAVGQKPPPQDHGEQQAGKRAKPRCVPTHCSPLWEVETASRVTPALLLQPGCPQCLAVIEKEVDARDLAVAKLEEPARWSVNRHSAALSAPAIAPEREYAVAEVPVFLRDRLKVLPAFAEHCVEVFETFTPPKLSRYIQQLGRHHTVRGSGIENDVDVAPIEGVGRSLHQLHVLLRHRLALKLHGFERFRPIAVDIYSADLAVDHTERSCPAHVNRHSARVSPTHGVQTQDHGVSALDDLLDIRLTLLEGLRQRCKEVQDGLRPHADARVREHRRVMPNRVLLEPAGRAFIVTAEHRIEGAADYLHVLLRHRLLLQPHGFEGLLVVEEVLSKDDAAVAVGVHLRPAQLLFDAAALSARVPAPAGEDSISEVHRLFAPNDMTDIRQRLQGTIERRTFDGASLQLRDLGTGTVGAGGNKAIRVTGYAATTEEGYQVGGGSGAFTETIARGAFKRTLGESPDVVLNINHAEGGQLPLARTRSGTLILAEDSRGLKVDAELDPDDPEARAVASKVRRGDVDSMSFAFRATDDDWSEDRSKRVIRSLTLHRGDVSFVSQPANESTSVSVRRRGAKKDVMVVSRLSTIKAKRAKLRRREHRADEPKYSPEQIQRFGEETPPRAFKKANGKFGWPICDGEDVENAVSDYNRLKPKPAGVRAWIIKRARELRVEHRLPKGWGVVTPKPGPNATEPQLTGTTETSGGQSQ